MENIILGKTGLKVNRLGFGGIPIQRVSEEEAIDTVRYAIEKGMNFIDTARAYTTSEEWIGKALNGMGQKVVLASKSQARTADEMKKDIEISLKLLQKDYIDIYQCHFVKDLDIYKKIIGKGGALEALQAAKNEGLIGHIGVTGHCLDTMERILDDDIFETIMICYSFLEPKADDVVIPKALAKKVGVIIMKAFSGGAIDDAEAALKFVLQKRDTLIIPGIESRELFDQNFSVYEGDRKLTAENMAKIRELLNLYSKKFCRRCDYCQPCPENINIQGMLGLKFMAKRLGEALMKRDWFDGMIKTAEACTECEECVERCPYDLPIPELIKENRAWVKSEI